ncbi:5'-3' exonuclease H3TH domain-containing protein [Paraburkholderia sp. EG287A]|uniref:5'-3' exonuclease n=1 Tax=Paraburkholderia sp. EG287A TaxID=3237012 RepID=UPI0034D1D3A2
MNPKLLAVDGLGMLRRIYGANPSTNEQEKAEGTIVTMQQSFRRALREHEPTHCLFAFDAGGQTWRHELYPPYKAGRQPMTAELQAELVKYKQQLAEEGWVQVEHPGHEADDTLNSVAFSALSVTAEVVLLASDKDVAAAGQYGAKVYDHFEHAWHNSAWCWNKFGVGPDRLQDWLALVGDSTDGVPGVPKVGDKTATKLLREHGDLEGVLAAAATFKGKVGENLRNEADTARLSRQLTALRVDLFPAGLDWDTMRVPRAARH